MDEDFYPFNPLSKDHECKKKSEKPYHMGPAYLLKNSENDIKYEIFDRGSVQGMHEDFFNILKLQRNFNFSYDVRLSRLLSVRRRDLSLSQK